MSEQPKITLPELDGKITQRETRESGLNIAAGSTGGTIEEQNNRTREYARQWIALITVGSFAFIVVASFFSLWIKNKDVSIDDIVKVIDAITTPVVGIVGAVAGFYFGESKKL